MRRNLLILGLIGLAACGGNGDALVIPTTVPKPVTTPAAVPTTSPPPTTVVATTVPVETTAPAETTTTLSPEADVAAGWAEIAANLETCSRLGPDCDPLTIGAPNAEITKYLTQRAADRREDGLRYIIQPETHRTLESVTILGSDWARVGVCEFDANWIVDPQDPLNPDDDIIVNDSKETNHLEIELVRVDGRWREATIRRIDHFVGEEDQCDA